MHEETLLSVRVDRIDEMFFPILFMNDYHYVIAIMMLRSHFRTKLKSKLQSCKAVIIQQTETQGKGHVSKSIYTVFRTSMRSRPIMESIMT